jgi:diguanylate cyclase (GGDEF)-like protein
MAMAIDGMAPGPYASSASGDGGRVPLDPRAILTSIGEAVYDWDITSDQIAWGANASEVLGLSDLSGVATGRAFGLVTEPDSGQTRHAAIFEANTADPGTGVPYRTRYALRLGQRVIAVEDSGRWYGDAEGRPAFAHGVVRVTPGAERAAREVFPGLRDRAELLAQFRGDVAEAGRGRQSVTLMVATIGDLAALNEQLGYERVDGIIEEVQKRLHTVLRRRDRYGRYSGNRFAIALLSCPAEQAKIAASRFVQAVESKPIVTDHDHLAVRLCVGAATAPDHATDAASLLRRAEDALALVDAAHGQRFVLYQPEMMAETAGAGSAAPRKPGIDVLDALNTRRIVFARQPVVDASTRAVAFGEALLRLRTPKGQVVTAGDMLPAVERAGLVPLVDARMLELAADYLVAHPSERLAINVSSMTIEGADWLSLLAAHLGARPGIASRLIIELTETAAAREPALLRGRLDAMKALGLAIAIDDFGAGHTSFKHLRSFPVDILKIDGAFVQNLSRSTDDRFFVRTLVDLAQHLNIATVAEWVHDEETADMLRQWGVDYLQGEHCGVPVIVDTHQPARRKAGSKRSG